MLRFSKTIFIPLIAFPILIATHGFQNKDKGANASWVEHILGTSWLHFLFEISLTVYIVFLGVHGMKRATTNVLQESLNQLTAKEKDTLIKEWKPDPLVPVAYMDKSKRMVSHRPQIVCEGKVGKYVQINGRSYLNFASYNILNLVGNNHLEEVAKTTIKSYGVGSCGPRGFYGTMDVHLQLEEKLARFMECEEAILYSYGTATISSAIPAYAKRGDLIFVDEGVNYAIQQGLTVSRSTLKYFSHNNLHHLESLLEDLQRSDQIALNKPRRKFFDRDDVDHPSKRRVFLVVEGLYANYGDLCPLPQLIALKKRYKFRIFLDETYSIGIVGRTGRGVTEHFGVKREDVDLIAGSLEHSLGSTGGFCCGSSFIIDHQRLSGLGYCFSASLPPLLASAASAALDIVTEKPEMFEKVEFVSLAVHKRLIEIPGFVVDSWDASPIKHMRLRNHIGTLEEQYGILNKIVERVFQNGRVVILTAKYSPDEIIPVTPSIRVIVNIDLSEEEMDQAADDLRRSSAEILTNYR